MITLHIHLTVRPGQSDALEQLYAGVYMPAISKQPGFRRGHLLRAADDPDAYEIDIFFDDEAARLRWVASPDHDSAWPQIESVCASISSLEFDVIAGG